MKQMTFADAEYAGKRKQTRKELFLRAKVVGPPILCWPCCGFT